MVMVVVIEKAMVVVMMVVGMVFITDRVGVRKVMGLQFWRVVGMCSGVSGSCDDLLSHLFTAFDLLH